MRRQNNFYWPLPLSSAGMQAPVFRQDSVQHSAVSGQRTRRTGGRLHVARGLMCDIRRDIGDSHVKINYHY